MMAGGNSMSSTFLVTTLASTTRLESIAGPVPMMDPPSPDGASGPGAPSIGAVSCSNHASSWDTSSGTCASKALANSSLVALILRSMFDYLTYYGKRARKVNRETITNPGTPQVFKIYLLKTMY